MNKKCDLWFEYPGCNIKLSIMHISKLLPSFSLQVSAKCFQDKVQKEVWAQKYLFKECIYCLRPNAKLNRINYTVTIGRLANLKHEYIIYLEV